MRFSRFFLGAALLLAACGDDGTSARPPAAVAVHSGNGQPATAGQPAPNPLVVRVTDESGDPVRGVAVQWAVTAGDGTLSAASSETASDGLAQVQFTLGPRTGAQTVTATVDGLPSVVFSLAAAAGPAARVVITNDSMEVALIRTGATYAAAFADANGNPAAAPAGASIQWRALTPGLNVSTTNDPTRIYVSAGAAGRFLLEARNGALADTAVYLVRQVPARVFVGATGDGRYSETDTTRASVLVWDAGDSPIAGAPVTFRSTRPQVASVDATGKITFLLPDTVTILATSGNATGGIGFAVAGLFRVASVSAGGHHSCALTATGQAYCWGSNAGGQLMISARVSFREVPTAAETELRFTSIGAAEWPNPEYSVSRFDRTHTCALATSSDIYCWGNYTGATGRMPGDRQWGLLSVGARHNCALTTGGEAYCWGQADEGQVGGPTADQCRRDANHFEPAPCAINPVPVAGGRTYARISAGTAHSCALTQAGAAFCWGRNSSGQLGNGGTTQADAPVAVQGAPAFVDISAGGNHTCARTAAGAVYCWGAGNAGQLGNGSSANSSTPVQVAGSYASLSAGWMHTCALRADGAAFCWGVNELGQLGTGSTTSSATPAAVTGGIAFSSVSAGGRHTCGVRASDSAAFCWGDNGGGKLGFGTGASRATPRPVRNP